MAKHIELLLEKLQKYLQQKLTEDAKRQTGAPQLS
jgi:hypothetical protein